MDRLDAMAACVAVADTGAFVAAARRLGRSPTVVTRAIARLEARLGVRLFTRTTRAVALTDAGRRWVEHSRRVLSEIAAVESEAVVERVEPTGLLTVAASVVFGRLHVMPLVTEFLRQHPAVAVRLELADRVTHLIEEGIDVGIRLGALADSSLKAIRTGYVRRGVYASPSYLAGHPPPRTPGDLVHHTCLAFTGTTPNPTRWSFGSGKRRTTAVVQPRLVVNLAEAAIDGAVAGIGLTCVLSYMVDDLVAARALQPVLVDWEPPPRPIHVVHAAGRNPPAKTRSFVDHAVRALRRKFAG